MPFTEVLSLNRKAFMDFAKNEMPKASFASYSDELKRFEKAALQGRLDLATRIDGKNHERFAALNEDCRWKLISRLSLLNEVLDNSVRILGTHPGHFYLRSSLKKFGWSVPPDVYELIGKDDTIEIYGTDFSLKTANIRFLQVCSYTLEEILTHEFFELFSRDSKIAEGLMKHWPTLASGEAEIITDLGPPHLVQETFSQKRKQFWVESKVLARVSDQSGRVVGPLYSATVSVLES